MFSGFDPRRFSIRAVAPSLPVSLKTACVVLAVTAVSACKDDATTAARHLERAGAYVAEGDPARARLEYLNALKLQPNNLPARVDLAELLRATGERDAAYAQFRRVVEQEPNHLSALLELSELAMERLEWVDARGYTDRAAALAPDDAGVAVRLAVLAYADATEIGDAERIAAAHADLLALRSPEAVALLPMHYALIDGFVRQGAPEKAMQEMDVALAQAPGDLRLLSVKTQLLHRLGRQDEIAGHIRQMIALYPANGGLRTMLADWYLETGDIDAAEAVTRDRPDAQTVEAKLAVVRFLAQHRGTEAALAELEQLIAEEGAPDDYRLLRAAIHFDAGQQDAALAEAQEVAQAARDRGEAPAGALLLTAQMRDKAGDRAGAEETLRALLADTPLHLEANQLLATYLLDRGQPEPALRYLVAAQSVNAQQPQTLSLLSRAYAASGDAVMARQLQSEAFDASGRAPDAALRYALLLADAGSESAAIDVLNASLARFPEDLGLLTTLGEQYRLTAQWERAASIEDRLRQIGTGQALLVADRIRFDRQVAEEDIEVAIGYLDQRWTEGRDSAASYAAITRANLSSGHPERARRVLELGLSRFPEDRNLRAAGATLAMTEQKFGEAAAILQELLQDTPNNERLWIDLLRVRQRQDDLEAAAAVIDAGLAANPGGALLRWELALNREARGDHDGAIEVYEALLADHPSSAPVRNNLAALLSTAREDGESLARAAEIAAPLAGSPVPQFLDTYGWIAFRRNAFGPAAEALTAAARQLRDNPKVRFHAAEALVATDRGDEARQHYEAVIRLAVNDNDPLAARARAALDAMPADGTEAAN